MSSRKESDNSLEAHILEQDDKSTLLCVAKAQEALLNAFLTERNLQPLTRQEGQEETGMVVGHISAETYSALQGLSMIDSYGKMNIFDNPDSMLDAEYAEVKTLLEKDFPKGTTIDRNIKQCILQNFGQILSGCAWRDILSKDGGMRQKTATYYRNQEAHTPSYHSHEYEPGELTNKYSQKFLTGTFEQFFADVDHSLAHAGVDPTNSDLSRNHSDYYNTNLDRLYEAYKALLRSGYGRIEAHGDLG